VKHGFVLVVGLATVAALGALAWFASAPRPLEPAVAEAASAPGDADAGRIVFHAAGCASCHKSPGQPDPLRLGGGMELKTPFGSFYPPNISPDAKDGVGAWSGRDFAAALLAGVSPRGEHYYPVFPYPSYRRMTPTDVRDLLAFLRTLPAVAGRSPPHAIAFPFALRRSLGLWKRLYLGPRAFPDAPDRDASWKLGRYLVEAPGHCGECHSPRNLLGAVVANRRLSGAPIADGKGKAPDITAAGLKDWSKADIVEALTSGFTPTGDTLGGPMAEVVRETAQLPPAYREAIADYLKSLTPGG
jgi:mono/diheme cytochrome c family protein